MLTRYQTTTNAKPSFRQMVQGTSTERIIQAVCEALNVSREDLTGPGVTGDLREARRIAIGLILISDRMITLKQVGAMFRRDYSTIIYNRDEFENQNGIDKSFTRKVKMVTLLFGHDLCGKEVQNG